MYEIEPHEVEALADNLVGDLLADQDPLRRYHALTREQALYDRLVSEIKRYRGKALAELCQGHTQEEVADLAGLGGRQRVAQLVAAGDGRDG